MRSPPEPGVSPATVSRVFTQPDAVATDTRSRVLRVADELNYTPNPVARSLARGRTGNLGIVVPDMANSFSAVIAKAVQQEARRDGYALFVAGSDELAQDEEQWARAMAPQVDGLLLISPLMPDAALLELAAQGPLVLVNRLHRRHPRGPHRRRRGAPRTPSSTCTRSVTGAIIYLAGPDGYSNYDAAAWLPRRVRPARHRRRGSSGPFQARFSAGVRAADLVLAAARPPSWPTTTRSRSGWSTGWPTAACGCRTT